VVTGSQTSALASSTLGVHSLTPSPSDHLTTIGVPRSFEIARRCDTLM
jgi:hypothetical protein